MMKKIKELCCSAGILVKCRSERRVKLPRYMLPAVIERRQEFPYNANGKIDRRKIMEIYYGKNN